MRLAAHASGLLAAGTLFASLVACAGKEGQASGVDDTIIAAGPCATAGQTATCFDQGRGGTQTCLASLMLWSTCAPAGQTSSTAQPECRMGDKQACNLGPGIQAAQVCVASGSGTPVWTDCCAGQTTVSCSTSDNQAGVALCTDGQVGSGCGVVDGCDPRVADNRYVCELDGNSWEMPQSNQNTPPYGGTPLVLAFQDQRVVFTSAPGDFDVSGREASFATGWVSAETPWLAMDLDGNGRIDDGRELFGSMTELPGGERAPNGFVALAALDDDGDGAITPRDAAFGRLLLWSDRDQDRQSSRDEIVSAAQGGLVAIRLDYRSEARCVGGDCEIERARFVFRDADGGEREGSVVDVYLGRR